MTVASLYHQTRAFLDELILSKREKRKYDPDRVSLSLASGFYETEDKLRSARPPTGYDRRR